MDANEQILKQIQSESLFESKIPFEEFVHNLCKRYTKIHSEILPFNNYEVIIQALEKKGIINPR